METRWFSAFSEAETQFNAHLDPSINQIISADNIEKVKAFADARLIDKSAKAKKRLATSRSADDKWTHQALESGTLSDKIAMMSIKLSQEPLQFAYLLDALLKMVRPERSISFPRYPHAFPTRTGQQEESQRGVTGFRSLGGRV